MRQFFTRRGRVPFGVSQLSLSTALVALVLAATSAAGLGKIL